LHEQHVKGYFAISPSPCQPLHSIYLKMKKYENKKSEEQKLVCSFLDETAEK